MKRAGVKVAVPVDKAALASLKEVRNAPTVVHGVSGELYRAERRANSGCWANRNPLWYGRKWLPAPSSTAGHQ